eukprot:TRINITY_DN2342_c0_g1_i4.p1 TRINITY_DN2342_c0_g1~~TRINITY_DN2342_c0_g1_i4.p1  ORF type:complete len:609 (-),score=72.36 TRINITY_DN2342_c0_g1_i4:296-2122(-)
MLRLLTKCCPCPWRPPVDEEQFAYKKLSSSSNGEPTQPSAPQINQNAPQTTNYDGEDFDSSIPETFICSITGQLMNDPVVVAGSGNVYERQAITRWLEKSDKDPMTNLMLKDKQLVPLHALKSQIQEFQFRRQQFHQLQQQLQNNQIGQNTEGQGREVSAQIPRAIEQTNFQRIIDEFGDVFVFLFKNISRKKSVYLDYKSVFTDQYTRQALLNLPNEIDQIDKDVKMLQDEYDAITDYQNARDTSEEISKITSQILDLQQQKKDKLAKLEVAQKVREHLQIYSSAGSSSKTYKCIQLQGLKPTKYVPTSSTLMVATARFEKAVIILQAEISRILSKEVSIEKLDEELQNAVVRQQAERRKKSEQLRFAIGSESSVGNAKLIQEEYNKADEIFTNLQQSADEVERTYKEFLKTLSDFELSLGLCPQSDQDFEHMLRKGGNVRNAKLNIGLYNFKVTNNLQLQDCQFTGERQAACLILEAEGQRVSITNCSFNNCGIMLKGFAEATIQNVTVNSSPQNGIYICNTKKASAYNTITTNSGSKFQDYSGFYFENVEMVNTKECKSSGNSGSGFVFSKVLRCNVTQCSATNNGKAGVGFWNGSNATIGGCRD